MTVHPGRDRRGRLEDLDGEPRRRAVEHLALCGPCRDRAVDDDPSVLFALLGDAPLPEGLLDQVSAGVAAAIDRGASRPALPVPGRRARPALAWAAAAGLAAVLLLPHGTGEPTSTHRREIAPGATLPSLPTLATVPRAGVEAIRTPGAAQVLDLTVGDTQVVMIFDQDFEL